MCMNLDVEDVADDLARKTDLALQNGHIIKIDNSFNKTHAFNRLTGSEQNIAWAIISMFSTDDTAPDHSSVRTRLTVDSTEIRNLAGIGSQGSRVTIADYKKFLDKLRTFFLTQFFVVHIKEGDVLVERGSPVFKYFDIRNGGDQICIELMPASAHLFSKIFNGIGFTIFALQKMVNISSPTAKTLYRLFLDGRHIHGWNATYEELAAIFGFTKKTAFYSFYRRLDRFIEQVKATGDFDRLEYQPIRDNAKRGHPIVSIYFDIKVKPDRLQKLVGRYHPTKPKKTPKFYALKVYKDSFEDVLRPNEDGTISATRDIWKTSVEIKCPECGSPIYAFLKNDGKVAFVCGNSKFWHLGNQDCKFFASEDYPLKLTDDLKLWLEKMHEGVKDGDLVEYLQTLNASAENRERPLHEESMTNDSADDDNLPFPLG